MATRNIPLRVARTEAINRLLAPVDVFPQEAEQDDIAIAVEESDELADEYDGDSDEVMEASDLEYENESSNSEAEKEEIDQALVDVGLISSSGVVWTQNSEIGPQGRIPSRNICDIFRQGFAVGLHPSSRKESFLVILQKLITLCCTQTQAYEDFQEVDDGGKRMKMKFLHSLDFIC